MRTERERVHSEARAWAARLAGDALSAEDRTRFEAWVRADPRHGEAFREYEGLLQASSRLVHLREYAQLQPEPGRVAGRARWPRVLAWGGALAASILAVMLVAGQWPSAGVEVYRTRVAEVREIRLEDGSVVTLGAHSRIVVNFNRQVRRVALDRGQAFFSVAHQANRPFQVEAGDVEVHVVGTQFDVTRGGDGRVRVDVLQGVVTLTRPKRSVAVADVPAPKRATEMELLAGDRALSTLQQGLKKIAEPTPVQAGAWRSGRLSYASARLADVVDDLNRYYAAGIEFDSGALGNLEVTASFRVENLRQFLDNLPGVLPVEVEFLSDGRVRLLREPSESSPATAS